MDLNYGICILQVHLSMSGMQGSPSVCEFSVSRYFFKTNVIQSFAELILYSQKTQNCGQFLSHVLN